MLSIGSEVNSVNFGLAISKSCSHQFFKLKMPECYLKLIPFLLSQSTETFSISDVQRRCFWLENGGHWTECLYRPCRNSCGLCSCAQLPVSNDFTGSCPTFCHDHLTWTMFKDIDDLDPFCSSGWKDDDGLCEQKMKTLTFSDNDVRWTTLICVSWELECARSPSEFHSSLTV